MAGTPINDLLAANLALFMRRRDLNQSGLAARCGVRQNTISLYLDPSKRKEGNRGKKPSGKLSEVERLAGGLGVEPWELLRGFTPSEREAYEHIEQAFRSLHPDKKTSSHAGNISRKSG